MTVRDDGVSFSGPPEILCACPVWDRWECVGIRYGYTRDYMNEQREMGDSGCVCYCHDEYDKWSRPDDDDDDDPEWGPW